MRDAISLFKNIVNNPLFLQVQIILFLNKKDIFKEKILRIPLTACFPNYKGIKKYFIIVFINFLDKNSFEGAIIYIKNKFESRIKDKQKIVYTHLTCATDTNQVQVRIDLVCLSIMRQK